MTNPKIPKLEKLENEPLWVETCAIVEYIYSLLHELPEEEQWTTTQKLRAGSNDLLYYLSQAISNSSPGALEYEWSNVRKQASGLKAMYRFAGKQKFIDLDPEIMVRLDKLLTEIDKKVVAGYKQTQATYESEITQWRKKYEIWKEMQK